MGRRGKPAAAAMLEAIAIFFQIFASGNGGAGYTRGRRLIHEYIQYTLRLTPRERSSLPAGVATPFAPSLRTHAEHRAVEARIAALSFARYLGVGTLNCSMKHLAPTPDSCMKRYTGPSFQVRTDLAEYFGNI